MAFKFQSEDGEIELLTEASPLKDLKTLESGTPHEGFTCSFKLQKLSNFSTGQNQTDEGILLATSNYLSSHSELEPKNKSVTIGVSSVSEIDRLIDVCLTKLHVGESGEFSLKCLRSKSVCNITLELISIDDSKELHQLSSEEIHKFSTSLKEQGVELFSKGFVIDAFYKFSKATKYIHLIKPRCRHIHQVKLLTTLQSNMASCHVKVKNWEDAIELCNMVLEQDPNNVKVLYRRGWSYIEIQEYEKAGDDLLKAKELDPGNQAVKNKLTLLDERKKVLNAKYAQAMKKFFS
ncbi:hypothetical protein Ocin01_14879 [Orchesella cincta]|uniref:Uncharacterized protein n=1 Tax=Orchesella cincta TaxID=48709 RepID=A0A1D2MFY4_ORCCI|nr:hypothetical protein Ocin01_14879 [Orchesella cincta]